GGIGQPSATTVGLSVVIVAGGNGGMGHPSALNVRSILRTLPVVLTNRATGSNINTANAEAAKARNVFFKGVSLLLSRMRRDSFGEVLCLKMFRTRNAELNENAYTAAAEPQGHSGFHADHSGGYSRTICAADLHG